MTSQLAAFDRAEAAATTIRSHFPRKPEVAVVLGSGLDNLAQRLKEPGILPYADIPHFPAPTVTGHQGVYMQARVGEVEVAVLQGRFHYYEGHDFPTVTLPVRVLQLLGTKILVLTAAVGGVNERLGPGQIVAISDHLNLIGANPLRGPNDERFGTRFPDMTSVYSRQLLAATARAATRLGIELATGVYAAVPGPSYETPAEVRMLRALGADVVGMSTVPEAIIARHGGMEVLGLAVVSNAGAGLSESTLNHEEVLAAGRRAGPRLADLLVAVIEGLNRGDSVTLDSRE